MSEKHTPGPWTAIQTPRPHILEIVGANGYPICQTENRISTDPAEATSDAQNVINARFIAAAPETLRLYKLSLKYIFYVQAKIDIDEIPFTFEQWKQIEIENNSPIAKGDQNE